MNIVSVVWADAHSGPGGWVELDGYEDDGEELVTTVGFMVTSDQPGFKARHITLWQTISGREGINPFHIPADMVRGITILRSVETALDF